MLEVRGIHSYYGQAHILSDVSLTLAQGEIVVLLGRNGAGKSTTIKSIMGMVKVGAGSIAYEGEDILGEEAHRIARRGLGYVPEERRIFTRLTVQENLGVSSRTRNRYGLGVKGTSTHQCVADDGHDRQESKTDDLCVYETKRRY
jgi:branched-chain amino acid transport system ATP-binding protein